MGAISISILVMAIISVISLIIKSRTTNDYSLLGRVAARIYLAGAIITYFFVPNKIEVEYIHIGIALMLFSDVVVNILFFFTKKYRTVLEEAKLLKLLKELGDKYATVVENALVGFYVIDSTGTLEYVNPYLCTMLGYDAKENIKGKNVLDFLPAEEHQLFKEALHRRLNGITKSECYQLHLKAKDGSYILTKVLGSLTSNGHVTISGTCISIDHEFNGGCK